MKTILITGSTDGIGLETARRFASLGHRVLLHGRNADKLEGARQSLAAEGADVGAHAADLSDLAAVRRFAAGVLDSEPRIDVLVNNAGVFVTSSPMLADGSDVRFVVNTLAPAVLTRALLPRIPNDGRVLNLSSAAQAPVDLVAMGGGVAMADFEAYAQSKLALTMWSADLAAGLPDGPAIIAVNPGSFLATKMVKEGFGREGNDIGIGAGILVRLALDDEFAEASGAYWDNDAGRFAPPHPDAADAATVAAVVARIDELTA